MGQGISPALARSDAPAGTARFALIAHDPDAPTGGAGFWHWIVRDIPASASALQQGGGLRMAGRYRAAHDRSATIMGSPPLADAVHQRGTAHHRCDFTLCALPVATLQAPQGATASLVRSIVNMTAIATATLQGRFGR